MEYIEFFGPLALAIAATRFGIPLMYRAAVARWMREGVDGGHRVSAFVQPSAVRDPRPVDTLKRAAMRRELGYVVAILLCLVAQAIIVLAYVEPNPKPGRPNVTPLALVAMIAILSPFAGPVIWSVFRRAVGPVSWLALTLPLGLVSGAAVSVSLAVGTAAPGIALVNYVLSLVVGAAIAMFLLALQRAVATWLRLSGHAYSITVVSFACAVGEVVFYKVGSGSLRALALLVPWAAFPLLLIAFGGAIPRLSTPAPLVFLRTFGHERRSTRMLRRVARLWSEDGPIAVIVGTDIATRTPEHSDVLAFVTGRLRRQFLRSPDDVAQRLQERPGRDGLYDVVALKCLDSAWKDVAIEILRSASRVLMDLRGFTRMNRGSSFEIDLLLRSATLERVLFLVDATTDAHYLEQLAESAGLSREALPLWNLTRDDGASVRAILARLVNHMGKK